MHVRLSRPARVCARLASRQKGVVSRDQLQRAGLSRHQVNRLVRSGFLHRLYRGVYAVGHRALPPFGNEQAALLACGEGSVIRGRSALYLWGILEHAPAEVDVTVPGRHCRKRSGIRLHLVAAVDAREVRRRHGLAVMFPAGAIIDLAAEAAGNELERLIADARAARLLRDGELEQALDRAAGRPGTATLRAVLRAEGEPGITRSEGERLLRRYLRAAQLAQPKTNQKIGVWEVDFLWPEERVVVELDSYEFHKDRWAFERDRRKDMALRDAGYHVIRITGSQLKHEPLLVIAHIARALDRATRTHG